MCQSAPGPGIRRKTELFRGLYISVEIRIRSVCKPERNRLRCDDSGRPARVCGEAADIYVVSNGRPRSCLVGVTLTALNLLGNLPFGRFVLNSELVRVSLR